MKYDVVMKKTVDGWDHEARDRVPEEALDFYVTDAKSRWDTVEVSPEPSLNQE